MKKAIESIETIKQKFESKKIPLLGNIYSVSYSRLGECLGIMITGDVPMAMQPAEIVMVHPESTHGGWVGIGNIALNAFTHGKASIEKVPLCNDAIAMLEEIYFIYTGTKFSGRFYYQNDINRMTFGSALNAMA